MKKKKFKINYQVSFVYDEKKDIKRKGSRIVEATTANKAEEQFTELYYEANEEDFVTPPKGTDYLGTSFQILEVKEIK